MAGIGSRVSFRRNRMGPVLIGSEQALQLRFFIACRRVLDRIRHFQRLVRTMHRFGGFRCSASAMRGKRRRRIFKGQ